jgi:hypothetical protein
MQGAYGPNSQRLQHLDATILDMAQHFNDSKVQELAIKAIHMISQKYRNVGDYLGREGACEAVIAAVLKHRANTSTVNWGLNAVLALAQCKPVHIHKVGDDNSTRLRIDSIILFWGVKVSFNTQ